MRTDDIFHICHGFCYCHCNWGYLQWLKTFHRSKTVALFDKCQRLQYVFEACCINRTVVIRCPFSHAVSFFGMCLFNIIIKNIRRDMPVHVLCLMEHIVIEILHRYCLLGYSSIICFLCLIHCILLFCNFFRCIIHIILFFFNDGFCHFLCIDRILVVISCLFQFSLFSCYRFDRLSGAV